MFNRHHFVCIMLLNCVWTLRNCFLDFAVEHWFGCRATEPVFTGDIGAIEVWLVYFLKWCIMKLIMKCLIYFYSCLPNPLSNLYLVNLNVVSRVSTFSTYIIHLVLLLLSSVSCRINCPIWPHSLMIWYWWGISTFTLNLQHQMLDSSPVHLCLLIWISTSIFLLTFLVILLISWFSLKGVTCFLYHHHLMSLLITFLSLLIWKFLYTSHTVPQTIT